MALKKYKLGELIELVEETNSEGMYGPEDVRGMTITKEIIPTKADVASTDLHKFIVVHPNEFVFNPRTHGKKIGFGYNNTEDCFLISWNNIAFRVKKDAQNIVIPTYLFLHFNRQEWDREACFCSWGSSTEVFSWDALCDMKLNLPSISQQRKYAQVYLALQNNLAAYQSKVDELKLVCDGYIEDLRRKMKSEKIVKFIKEENVRNKNNALNNVLGVCKDKTFIPTVANMLGIDLTNYKVVKPNWFAYSNRINIGSIALRYNTSCLVSPSYTVFSVDESKLYPEYLSLWLERDEFLHFAFFYSIGTIKDEISVEELGEMEIPIPDIAVQQEIVNIHKCYIERQRIAARLKEQLNNLCPILVKGSLETAGK